MGCSGGSGESKGMNDIDKLTNILRQMSLAYHQKTGNITKIIVVGSLLEIEKFTPHHQDTLQYSGGPIVCQGTPYTPAGVGDKNREGNSKSARNQGK